MGLKQEIKRRQSVAAGALLSNCAAVTGLTTDHEPTTGSHGPSSGHSTMARSEYSQVRSEMERGFSFVWSSFTCFIFCKSFDPF